MSAGATVQSFYIDEFSDARVRAKWEACKADADCRTQTLAAAKGFTQFEARDTGKVDKRAEIDFDGAVDLTRIRRPAYFGQGDYSEAIAKAEPQTFVIEFTVPRDSYEIRHLNLLGRYQATRVVPQGSRRRR